MKRREPPQLLVGAEGFVPVAAHRQRLVRSDLFRAISADRDRFIRGYHLRPVVPDGDRFVPLDVARPIVPHLDGLVATDLDVVVAPHLQRLIAAHFDVGSSAEDADQLAESSPDGAMVWVHDYQLMRVPEYLRQLAPDRRVAFFLHIPFPAPELFLALPWRSDLLEGAK